MACCLTQSGPAARMLRSHTSILHPELSLTGGKISVLGAYESAIASRHPHLGSLGTTQHVLEQHRNMLDPQSPVRVTSFYPCLAPQCRLNAPQLPFLLCRMASRRATPHFRASPCALSSSRLRCWRAHPHRVLPTHAAQAAH